MPTKIKHLVFIVSGGRTGTQFLGDRITEAIPESYSEHEPDVLVPDNPRSFRRVLKFGLWGAAFGKLVGRTGIRSIGTARLKGRISAKEAAKRIESARKKYHQSIEHRLIIESNGQWNYACAELSQVWPHAKIAVIIRDPRSWIRSWLNKGTRWQWQDTARWLPPGRPTPSTVGDDKWASTWRHLDAFGRLAWEWQFTYSRLLSHAGENSNSRVFRFEDLFDQYHFSAMQDLIRFCAQHVDCNYSVKLPRNFAEKPQNTSKGSEPGWIEWSSERAHLLDQMCGELMRRNGYGTEPAWQEKVRSGRDQVQ